MKATARLEDFKKRLHGDCKPHGIFVIGGKGSRRTENVMRMLTREQSKRARILYVKDRSEGEGFWGINQNQVGEFERKSYEWSVILLRGPGERSYLGTSQQVKSGFQEWSFSSPDYKVHEVEIESVFSRFDSYSELIAHLISSFK
jgi:hypothetical protein